MRFRDILLQELNDASGAPVDAGEKALRQKSRDPKALGGEDDFETILGSGAVDDPTVGADDETKAQDAAAGAAADDIGGGDQPAGLNDIDFGDEDESSSDASEIMTKVSKHPFLARDPVTPEDDPLMICGKSISDLNQMKAQTSAEITTRERRKQFGTWDDEDLQYLRDKDSFITTVLNEKKPKDAAE